MAGSVRLLGHRGIGIWVVPAVTGRSHGSRAREIGGWTGYHWSYAKSRLDSTAATLPRHAGFSRQYHHYPRGLQSRTRGWIPMAGPGRNIVGGSHFLESAP